jgi:Fe-S cluster assembly protein SufD
VNMHVAPKLTPAETALVDAFADKVADLPGDPGMLTLRDRAVETIKAGLPTRRVESWHYTDLRRLLTEVPAAQPNTSDTVRALVDGSVVIDATPDAASKLPSIEGAAVARLAPAMIAGELTGRMEMKGADDAVGAINAAFASDGISVKVEPGAALASPVELQNVHAGGQVHTRLVVGVGEGARAVFVERHAGGAAAIVSSVADLDVADGAEVIWIIVQEQPDSATHLAQLNATIGKDAKLTVFFMNAGGKLVRQELRIAAAGENCEFTLRGVNLLTGSTHTDVTMVLDHAAYGASSTEVIRNVVLGKAQGVFQGQIRVAREAQKTDAKMACNTLLLSDEGEFSIKPELEIFADDVACGHGATVAEIERNHLFYLMARGIPEKESRGLLVKAFLAEVIEELADEALVQPLEARLDAWFAQHG